MKIVVLARSNISRQYFPVWYNKFKHINTIIKINSFTKSVLDI